MSSDFSSMEKKLSLQNVINAVREFHDAFKIPNSDKPNASLTEEEVMLRYRLMAHLALSAFKAQGRAYSPQPPSSRGAFHL